VAAPRPPARSRTLTSDLFVATLLADAVVNALTLHNSANSVQWIMYALSVGKMGTAILVVIQRFAGTIGAGMQRRAVVSLLVMGLLYYLRPAIIGMQTQAPLSTEMLGLLSFHIVLREIDIATSGVLGLIGGVLMLRSAGEEGA